MFEIESRLQNSPYFCVFKYTRAVKQKAWNKAWRGVRLLRHNLPISLLILRKKLTVSFRDANKTHFHKKVLKVSLLFCVRVFAIASQPEEFPWIGLPPVTKVDTGLATSQSQELSRECGLLHLPWSTLERLIHTFRDCSQSSCSNRYHLHFLHSPHGCYLTL